MNTYLKNNLSNLTFDKLKETLSTYPYNLIVKESKQIKSLFLLSNPEESKKPMDPLQEFLNSCNGIIYKKDTFEVVCNSFDCNFSLEEVENYPIENVEHMEEGTFIRLFHYDCLSTDDGKYSSKGEWFVSTLKCINTNETYIPYCKKNFDDMVRETIDIENLSLDKEYTYSWVLKHPENRCYINYTGKPCLCYVSRRNNKTGVIDYEFPEKFENISSISKSRTCSLEDNTSESDTLKIIKKKLEKEKLVTDKGFIFSFNNNGNIYRVEMKYKEYLEIEELRGSNPNIKIRYLELEDESQRKLLDEYFPEYKLGKIPNIADKKILDIYEDYKRINIFRKMTFKEADKNHKPLLFQLHSYYIATKKPITLQNVYDKFWSLDIKTIAFIMGWINKKEH